MKKSATPEGFWSRGIACVQCCSYFPEYEARHLSNLLALQSVMGTHNHENIAASHPKLAGCVSSALTAAIKVLAFKATVWGHITWRTPLDGGHCQSWSGHGCRNGWFSREHFCSFFLGSDEEKTILEKRWWFSFRCACCITGSLGLAATSWRSDVMVLLPDCSCFPRLVWVSPMTLSAFHPVMATSTALVRLCLL